MRTPILKEETTKEIDKNRSIKWGEEAKMCGVLKAKSEEWRNE